MKKIKKPSKISINTLLLLFDIPIVFLLINSENTKAADVYLSIRSVMICVVMFKISFKIFKTTIISFKKANMIDRIISILDSEDSFSDIMNLFKNIIRIFLVNIECLILMCGFMIPMTKFQSIISTSDTSAMFISIVSLNVVLSLIRIYINKRSDVFINSIQKESLEF